MKYSMKDVTASYTPEKRKDTSLWARVFSRPLSFPVTYILINLGVSANAVSVISIFVALAACILLACGSTLSWIGVFVFLFWDVMDCVDGNIARVKKTASLKGEYMDAISGYTAPAFIYLSLGIAAYNEPGYLNFLGHWIIVVGAVASLSDLLSRIIYQKFLVTQMKLNSNKPTENNIEEERKSGLKRIIDVLMKNLTYSSLFMPLLVIAKFTHCFDILAVLYCLYSVFVLIGSYVMFIRKALRDFE